MAFWGVEVKPGKPFTLESTEATGIKRLHLSQATLGLGKAILKSTLQCNVGNKSPLFLCVLTPDKVDSCQLNLEFEEADEVIFSVIGPRSIHLAGYFLGRSTGFRQNDDESESYGEDINDTDMEKASSDDYDYNDSFINDGDPSARGSHFSSTDDDEISIKELAAKTKDKKRKGKGGRLRKKFQIFDSDSDETSARADDDSINDDSVQVCNNDNDYKIPKVLSSEIPLTLENGKPSAKCEKKTSEATTHTNKTLENGEPNANCEKKKKTAEATTHTHKTLENGEPNVNFEKKKTSEARTHTDKTLENGEPNANFEKKKKTSEATTHTHKSLDKREDNSLGDVELSPVQKGCETLSNKKQNKRSKSSVVINSEDGEGKHMPESLQNEKPAPDKEIKSSSDVLPSQNATLTKKKRKMDRRDETRDVRENLFECSESKKQAIDKNIEKEDGGAKEPLESEISSNEVIIEEIEKGKLEGKSAVKGRKVSIFYTGKLKDTGKLFDSNLGEAPLRFLIGGENVIEGLSIGVEGMRVGDKRRLIIPPSLGYSEEGLKEAVLKNAWLVYEVEAVKIR